MHIPTVVFIFILFQINILLLLLCPKHVIKQLGYNLGCYRCPYWLILKIRLVLAQFLELKYMHQHMNRDG